jgi:hypothetical protein
MKFSSKEFGFIEFDQDFFIEAMGTYLDDNNYARWPLGASVRVIVDKHDNSFRVEWSEEGSTL